MWVAALKEQKNDARQNGSFDLFVGKPGQIVKLKFETWIIRY